MYNIIIMLPSQMSWKLSASRPQPLQFSFPYLLSLPLTFSICLCLFSRPFPAFCPDAAIKEKDSFIRSGGGGGAVALAGGAWLAWMHGFRQLPQCKVIVIKSWLTVVDCAFEVQTSFLCILKSPFQQHLLVRSHKKVQSHIKC